MPEQFQGQHTSEDVDFVFRQHTIVMRKAFMFSLLTLTLGTVPISIWPTQPWTKWFLLAALIISIIILGYRFLGWYFSVYIITSERLIQIRQKGFFNRNVHDVSHNRIQSVNYEVKGLQATMLGYGTVVVQTYVGDLVLRYIRHPEEVQQHLNRIIRNVTPVDPSKLNGE